MKLVTFFDGKAKPKNRKDTPRGCEHCPLDKIPGVKKIMGGIYGRDILIIGQSPGPDENEEGREFVGRSGEFLWDELEKVGIKRTDVDLQNTVRCFPCDPEESSYDTYLRMRSPSPEEIHCCSIHTDNMLPKVKAAHILILGQIAQKAFLKTKSVPTKKIFWSEQHKAMIYLGDHPSYFIRGYGQGERLNGFRSLLQQLSDAWRAGGATQAHLAPTAAPKRFAYMRRQKYYYVETREQARKADHFIRKKCLAGGQRLATDIEDDVMEDGDRHVFAVGFCPVPGVSFTFDMRGEPAVRRIAIALLEDEEIRKAMHYGCTDEVKLQELEGITIAGFDLDTHLGSYMLTPGLGAYGLEKIAEREYPEFSGYKSEIVEALVEVLPEGVTVPSNWNKASIETKGKWLSANGYYNLSKLSKNTIRLYNGADCDLTKRIEQHCDGAPEVPAALMQLYMDLNIVLMRMEQNGPLFDRKQHASLEVIYEYKEQKKLDELRKEIKDPNFNPGSPPQVMALLYDKMNLKFPFAGHRGKQGKINTQKKTLLMLKKNYPKIKVPQLIIDWRKLSKGNSTYIKGYKICADMNNGYLRTKWNSTGTVTGRLSSGGKKQDPGVVNFQNIHGDPQMQNMCVADKRWRVVFKAIHELVKLSSKEELFQKIEDWVREHMPDLKTYLILDYGQVEVRVAAQISGDENLMHDCLESDIHTTVGVVMTGWSADMIAHDKQTRTLTKNVHFGILFGISKENLYDFIMAMTPPPRDEKEAEERAKNPITPERVSEMYDRYFARYRKVKEYIENQREFARENGYVETLFGLRRKLNVDEVDEENTEFIGDDDDERGTYWGNQAVNCVDFKTEALTQRGWVNGRDLRAGDVLLTKNANNGRLEWQSCTDVKAYPDYDRPLMEFRSRSFSAASTLDHRWLTGNGKCTLTKDITENKYIHRTGSYYGPAMSPYTDDFIRLAGWWLTDGSMRSGEGYSKSACSIWQSKRGNPKKVKMLDELFERLHKNEGMHYRTPLPKNRINDEVGWHFAGRYGVLLRALFPQRELTPYFLSQLPAYQLEILMHTMLLGDGSGSLLTELERKDPASKLVFGTGSLAQAEVFQMLVSLTGRQGSLSRRNCGKYNETRKLYASMNNNPQAGDVFYQVTICRRKVAHIYPSHKRMIKNKGVWCPMVPNTYFVARRDGFVYVTGNTPIQGSAHQLMECALVNLKRKPKRYRLLGVPNMEVHDALYMTVLVLKLFEAKRRAKYLLEKDSLATVKSDFSHIDWEVPIVTESEAGIRLGCKIELDDKEKPVTSVGQYLYLWYEKCKKQIMDMNAQLQEVAAAA